LKNKFDLFGYKYNFSEERTGYKFRVCSMNLVSFVESIGKGASNKKIHPDIFLENKENISAFLDGLIESDGTYDKKNNDWSAIECYAYDEKSRSFIYLTDIMMEHFNLEEIADGIDWRAIAAEQGETGERASNLNPVFENIFHSFGFYQS